MTGFVATATPRPGVDNMVFIDKTLVCLECECEFEFSAEQQRELAARGFMREPRRCPACDERRAKAKKPPNRRPRPPFVVPQRRGFYPAVCTACGRHTQVPFQPKPGRPVYCRDCFTSQGGGNRGPRSAP